MNYHNDNLNRASGAHDTLLSKRGMAAKAAAFLCILAAMIVCGIMVGSNANIAQAAAYTAEEVQEMYDALPTAAEVDAMDNAGQNEVYTALNTCYDAWLELTEAEQEAIGEEKFDELYEYFATGVVPAADSSTIDINYYWNYPGSSAKGNLYDTVSCSRTASSSTCLSPGKITYVRTLDNGTKSIYAFMGWSTSSSATSASYVGGDALTVSGTDDISVYGVWSVVKIVFNSNGGTSYSSISLDGLPSTSYSTYDISSYVPTRTNYTFNGWSYTTDDTWSGKSSISSYTIYTTNANFLDEAYSNTVTLVASWTYNGSSTTTTYTVSYNANGGSGAPSSQTKTKDVTLTLSTTTPTRAGYYFTGWNTSSDGSGTSYSAGGSYTRNANATLYAQWSARKTTVVLYKDSSNSSWATYVMTYGSSSFTYTSSSGTTTRTTAAVPTLSGYTFGGWYNDTSYSTQVFTSSGAKKTGGNYWDSNGNWKYYSSSSTNVTITIYAKWTGNTYSIKFNANGGTGSMSNLSMTYGVSKNLTSNNFSKTGYHFAGWDTSSTGSTVVYTNGQSVSNLATSGTYNLYAVWAANTTTVTFNLDSGTAKNSIGTKTLTYNSSTNSSISSLSSSNVTRTGYILQGWYSSAGVKIWDASGNSVNGSTYWDNNGNWIWCTTQDSSKTSITVYARWTPITYNVVYDGNGNTNTSMEMATTTVTYDEDLTLETNTYVRTGYTFLGWSESKTATTPDTKNGTKLTDGATITAPNYCSQQDATKTLYAVWRINEYTIVYDANGGVNAPSSSTKQVGKACTLKNVGNMTRDGYTCVGWSTEEYSNGVTYALGESVTDDSYFSIVDGDTVTLYAIWVHDDSNFNMSNVIQDANMFAGDGELVGGAGTEWDPEHIDSEYAQIDGGSSSSTPGYFTGR